MVEIIKEGFEVLAKYAERMGKPDAAARLRARREEDMRFVEKEGFAHVTYRSLAELRKSFLSDHLATVAKEALRVSDGEFVHTSGPSVVQGLRERMKEGNPWLNPEYKDSTLQNHISHSGTELHNLVRDAWKWGEGYRYEILVAIIGSGKIRRNLSQAWLETLDYAAEVLPAGTTMDELATLIRNREFFNTKSVEERIERVRAYYKRMGW